MEYKIEKDVPFEKRGLPIELGVCIKELNTGESVLFETKLAIKVNVFLNNHKENIGSEKKFAVKKINNLNSRIWRIL